MSERINSHNNGTMRYAADDVFIGLLVWLAGMALVFALISIGILMTLVIVGCVAVPVVLMITGIMYNKSRADADALARGEEEDD